MVHTNNNVTYYINPAYLTFVEDTGYGANFIQVSASSSCYIRVFVPGLIEYDADGNYRSWKITAHNNKFPDDSAFYIYVRLERKGPSALVVYSKVLYNEDGSSVDGSVEASDTYYYIRIGEVSSTNGTSIREISYDTGRLESDQVKNEGTDLNEMWELDKHSTPWLIRAKQWLSSFTVKGFITLVGGLVFSNGDEQKSIIDVKRSTDTDDDLAVGDDNLATSGYVMAEIEKLDERFLSKIKDDETPHSLGVGKNLSVGESVEVGHNIMVHGTSQVDSHSSVGGNLTVEGKTVSKGGVQFSPSFIPGILTGVGGMVDEYGNGELESLIIRRFLEVPELRYNRVQVMLGDKWNAPGAGIFESVEPDISDGIPQLTGTGYLKLEDGEYGAIAVGDICMGIFHSLNANDNATRDEDDSFGNFKFAGFYTCYFTIEEITGSNNEQFRYKLRNTPDTWNLFFHPSPAMHFVCYGSFTNPDRQTSAYTTRTYTRLLKNQNDWMITSANIAMQYGDLNNLSLHGMDMKGYSIYLADIYMTGSIQQVKPDGTPLRTANDRGEWRDGLAAEYYDRFSYQGNLWLCIAGEGTTTAPSKTDPAWLLQVEAGKSIASEGAWQSAHTPYPANTIITFANKVWISNKETSESPYPIITDNEDNRLTYHDGYYILYDEEQQSEDWDLLLDAPDLTQGKDGAGLELRFSTDKVSWHFPYEDGDKWMQQRIGEDGVWSDPMPFIGESGMNGADGKYPEFQFAVGDSPDVAPTTGWQDGPPKDTEGKYLWMRQCIVDPNNGTTSSWLTYRVKGDKGDTGEGIEYLGEWKSDMEVPEWGVVLMGGSTWIAKSDTLLPPLFTFTDNNGDRLLFADGGYILTGEQNEEYDLMVQSGKDGSDGKDHEYIFISTTEEIEPARPTSVQQDDYIPSGWRDDPVGTSESVPYEWVCLRIKRDGVWGEYSKPGIWSKWGYDGVGINSVTTSYGKSTSASVMPTSWQSDIPSVGEGEYLWTRVITDYTDESVEDTVSYTYSYQGKTGQPGTSVKVKSIQYQAGSSSTTPPAGNWSSNVVSVPQGQYLWTRTTFSDGSVAYGVAHQGADGDGFTMMGRWYSGMQVPKMGIVNMGGAVYAAKVATANPPLWTYTDNAGNRLTFKDGGYLLTGAENTSEYDLWTEKPEKGDKGDKGDTGSPGAQGIPGNDGLNGCVMRYAEWATNVQWRNDERETDKSVTRYLDIAFVRNDGTTSGWDVYKCIKTHTSAVGIAPYDSAGAEYWEKFAASVPAIFTNIIIGKNAHFDLMQGNDIYAKKSDGTVTAGMSGSQSGNKIRFFAGAKETAKDSAPFRVSETGETWMTNAHVTGEVNATSGKFTGEVQATSGKFTGEVNATKGTFNGTVNATGGKFQNVNIESASISGDVTVGESHPMKIMPSDGAYPAIEWGNALLKLGLEFLSKNVTGLITLGDIYNSMTALRPNKIEVSSEPNSQDTPYVRNSTTIEGGVLELISKQHTTTPVVIKVDANGKLRIYSPSWPRESEVSNGEIFVDGSGYLKVRGGG